MSSRSSRLLPPDSRFTIRENTHQYDLDDAVDFSGLGPGSEATLLKGGYSNANYLVKNAREGCVVRFYPDGNEVAHRELAIVELARDAGVRVPEVLSDVLSRRGKTATRWEYIEGRLLSQLIVENGRSLTSTFERVGEQLALIHSVKFDRSGLITLDGSVGEVFEFFPDTARSYIETSLKQRAGNRLGSVLSQKLTELLTVYWKNVENTFSGPSLLHCDFNPKNLIIDENDEVVVIDWEFAMSGHTLCDVGNFLRFQSEDYSLQMKESFIRGYEKKAQKLPENGEFAAKVLDLVALCSFLDREEELPETFYTAKTIIERTLREIH